MYKGLKPVNWCIHDRTALAEAEVEYENHSSPSIWVRFALTTDPAAIDPALAGKKVWGLIWTTTPWTIPANLGIAFHPRFTYAAVEVAGEVYIVAQDLLNATAEACGWESPQVLATFAGEKLAGTVFRHPFLERDSVGMLGDHVTLEQGTGAVHTAPGHGQEDYVIGVENGLPVYCPVDGAGRFFQAEGAAGKIARRTDRQDRVGRQPDRHRHSEERRRARWRRARSSTAIRIAGAATIRPSSAPPSSGSSAWIASSTAERCAQNALAAIKKVKWNPAWGEERIGNMIATRPDWCISRQRAWGVPIIVFYCDACQEPLTDRKILDRVVDLIRVHTADVWYSTDAAELAGPDAKCSRCGGGTFRKESDILDVWFDSGASHLAVLTPENHLPWPADMYLEGGDQYRGWFHSSLLIAVGLRGESPYRASATNGWTLDGEGHALSKSKGAEEVEKVINKYGAELLRLWTASVDFTEDVRFSDTIVSRLIEAYRKLRNTFRYTLGNLHDFDPETDAVPVNEMLEIDRWILSRAEDLVRRTRVFYDENAFHKVYRAIYDFATTDLSAVYFDVLKDRLYTAATKSHARRSGQTALYKVHYALTRLVAPLLAFTTEEVWSHTRKPAGAPDSVHLALLPEPEELASGLGAAKLARWERLLEVRGVVLKALEEARQAKFIGTSLEARVRLAGAQLDDYADDLPALFIVSQVDSGTGRRT